MGVWGGGWTADVSLAGVAGVGGFGDVEGPTADTCHEVSQVLLTLLIYHADVRVV